MALTLTSSEYTHGGNFPARCTCDGDNVPPVLTWSDLPEGTAELVLLFEDSDSPGGTLVQWAVFGIDPAAEGILDGKAPAGAVCGKNDYGRIDYAGPCPPVGRYHRFIFTLLAIKEPSGLGEGASPRDDVPYALSGKVLGQAQLMGKYARKR
ncbi:MAG TPA: YbhB/YbcL family Raf kinase inhibitor-like protein [Actinomycetota bacterium]|nr:YbhB/YbcL family Raf kinase inhibitor-like protein [Actinomycetota bacterium]